MNIDLPFVISETMTLRGATNSEVQQLNDHIKDAYGSASRLVVPFDYEPVEGEENGAKKTVYSKSNKPRWWVIAFNGYNDKVSELARITNLVDPKLHLGATFTYSKSNQEGKKQAVIYGGHSQIELLATESRKKHAAVILEELEKLKFYYNSISTLKNQLSHINYALDLYSSNSELNMHSGLLALSLFSIVESLIAHKPRLTETLDSITHQIKNKLNLLSKRYDIILDHSEYFGEISHMKLWSKLYGLRSDIAHGQSFDFKGGNASLKSLENTNNFLDKVTRELIKLSINESDLILDLREC